MINGPVVNIRPEDVEAFPQLSESEFAYGVEEQLLFHSSNPSGLVPGKYSSYLVPLKDHPSSADCMAFIRAQNGVLPGLPGLLAVWRAGREYLPMKGNDVIALQGPNEPIPSLNIDEGGAELHLMNWNCTSIGHLHGQFLLFLAKLEEKAAA